MKIGMIAGSIPIPFFINQLILNLASEDHKVFIYGALKSNVKLNKYLFIYFRVQPKLKSIKIIKSFFFIFKIIFKNNVSSTALLSEIWGNSGQLLRFFNRCLVVLPPFLDDLDILHIHWAKTLVYYPEFINQINCPICLSLRGTHINVSPKIDKNLAILYKKYFPKVRRFHAVSEKIAFEVKKYGVKDNITVIKPAINEKLLDLPISHTKINKSDFLNIISIGRCNWIKGYTNALDAMVILKNKKIKFYYTIIASGKDQENILYQIHDLGLNECVSFINDELSHDEVLKKISECDLFFLPSLEEGISNAVLEAMALGIPVISTDCGGMGEVIRNSENGFLVPVRDSESMAKAIRNFNDLDKMKKNNIIFNARETLIHNHLLSYQVDQFKSYYSKIV